MNKETKLRSNAAAATLAFLPNNLKELPSKWTQSQSHLIACFMAFKKTYTYWLRDTSLVSGHNRLFLV